MRSYFKFSLLCIGFAWVSLATAGSYEDFFQAISRDDPKAVSVLLERGFDPNTVNPDGLDGLFLALRLGSLKAAMVLIDWPKTRVETRTAQDESPLMLASLKGNLELVRLLIQRGADVSKPGWAPLHYAATNGHVAVMALLLEEHAYIDAESPNGTTPLMMAASYGSPQAVKLLLDEGADASLKNQLGLSALDFALRANRADAALLLRRALQAKAPQGQW